LQDAKIRSLMCTGDNILTAISVARECQIIPYENTVHTAEVVEGDVNWHIIDFESTSRTSSSSGSREHLDFELNHHECQHHNSWLEVYSIPLMLGRSLAITGDAFMNLVALTEEDPHMY